MVAKNNEAFAVFAGSLLSDTIELMQTKPGLRFRYKRWKHNMTFRRIMISFTPHQRWVFLIGLNAIVVGDAGEIDPTCIQAAKLLIHLACLGFEGMTPELVNKKYAEGQHHALPWAALSPK